MGWGLGTSHSWSHHFHCHWPPSQQTAASPFPFAGVTVTSETWTWKRTCFGSSSLAGASCHQTSLEQSSPSYATGTHHHPILFPKSSTGPSHMLGHCFLPCSQAGGVFFFLFLVRLVVPAPNFFPALFLLSPFARCFLNDFQSQDGLSLLSTIPSW